MVTSDAWVIAALPALAFVLILATGKRGPLQGAGIGVPAILLSLLLSVAVLFETIHGQGHRTGDGRLPVLCQTFNHEFPWLALGSTRLQFGWMVDPLTAVMLIVVTVVAGMVQIYSVGYMRGDPRFSLFYAYLSLFTAAMLGLVLANNLVLLYVCWEVMGLTSYLLIGFWFEKPEAARAAKKAFVVTRLGDVAFFFGIAWLIWETGTADLSRLVLGAQGTGPIGPGPDLLKLGSVAAVTWIAILLFGGSIGKSAQFPLHVWLPDAMEGPTPVSALIHAATMVAAGVYLVARMYPVFIVGMQAPVSFLGLTTTPLALVTWIGVITALLASLIALTQPDIKRILAYSTISQLGYMMIGLGLGSLAAGTFHLMTHAFFKALLFLAAGSVIHGAGTQEIWEMGGLRRKMPVTFATFLIGTLALSGIPPLAGFWSKDAILDAAWLHPDSSFGKTVFALGLFGAFLTAFYMTRLMQVTFAGEWRGGAALGTGEEALGPVTADLPLSHQEPAGVGRPTARSQEPERSDVMEEPEAGDRLPAGHHGPHESPRVMLVPLMVLAALSVVAGWVGTPWANAYAAFVRYGGGTAEHHGANYPLMATSFGVALAGIVLGRALYPNGRFALAHLKNSSLAMGLYRLSRSQFYFDDIYWRLFVTPLFRATRLAWWLDRNVVDGIVNATGWLTVQVSKVYRLFDLWVVDGLVNLCGWLTKKAGQGLRYAQSGQIQNYVLVIFLGAILIVWLFFQGRAAHSGGQPAGRPRGPAPVAGAARQSAPPPPASASPRPSETSSR
jgi:NADH-quinone oxidoreductase subunit L